MVKKNKNHHTRKRKIRPRLAISLVPRSSLNVIFHSCRLGRQVTAILFPTKNRHRTSHTPIPHQLPSRRGFQGPPPSCNRSINFCSPCHLFLIDPHISFPFRTLESKLRPGHISAIPLLSAVAPRCRSSSSPFGPPSAALLAAFPPSLLLPLLLLAGPIHDETAGERDEGPNGQARGRGA